MEALARRAAAPVFALALFSSAALIFVLQPLFGRLVTPMLGGSPAVWNTSMAFFQAALLLGYLYAHLVARLKDLRLQAGIHVLMLLAAWFVLPVHVSQAMGEPDAERPIFWLLGVLTLSVGAPFAIASATAPLLQAWYSRTGRADAHDPYYLYAASNLGSFIGLLAYPVLIEPALGAQAQSSVWTAGYAVVGLLIAACAAMALASNGPAPEAIKHEGEAPTWRKRLYWMAAAAVPSALSLGVTQHISTDVASAPMLWVAPLALYLATFVLAFMRGNEALHKAALFAHPLAIAVLIASYYMTRNWLGSITGILVGFFVSALVCHLALARSRPSADRLTEFYLFVSLGGVLGGAFAALVAPVIFNNVYEYPLALAAACLFRPRAAPDFPRLQDASLAAALMMGVLGVMLLNPDVGSAVIAAGAIGAAAMVVAAGWSDEDRPAEFRYGFLGLSFLYSGIIIWVAFNIERIFLPVRDGDALTIAVQQPWAALLIIFGFLMLTIAVHGTIQPRRDGRRVADFAFGVAIPTTILVIMLVIMGIGFTHAHAVAAGLCFCVVAIFFNRNAPIVMAAVVLSAFVIIFADDARGGRIITQERSFFGVLRTIVYTFQDPANPPMRALMHGTTLHGAQIDSPALSRTPLTYYHPRTALGGAIVAGLNTADNARLALIGLGTGSTACLMQPEDQLTIFEIDPAVVRLAGREGTDFTFVRECQPNARIVVGDARLKIQDETDGAFDVIVVDAFSSDAIPAHLLTREAIALYLSKLSENGVLVLHLSNRHLALVSEAARVAADLNVPTLFRISDQFDLEHVGYYDASAASAMVITRTPEAMASLEIVSTGEWRHVEAPPGRPWTDDYINLPRALWEGLNGVERCVLYPGADGCEEAQASAN